MYSRLGNVHYLCRGGRSNQGGGGRKKFHPLSGGGGGHESFEGGQGGGGHKSLTLPVGRHFFSALRILTLYIDRTFFPSNAGTEIANAKHSRTLT